MQRQILSVVLSLSLLWSSGGALEAAVASPDVFALPSNLPQFRLQPPAHLGRVTDYFNASERRGTGASGQTSPLIVLIQDLHANYGVQKNIAGLLEFLTKRLSPTPRGSEAPALPFAVAVEGAWQPVDNSILALYPDRPMALKAADLLLREAELTGPDLFAIERGIPHLLQGAEKKEYYLAHRDVFNQTFQDRQDLLQSLRAMQQRLEQLPRKLYTRPLVALHRLEKSHDAGRLSTESFVAKIQLEDKAGLLAGLPTLSRFVNNAQIEFSQETLRQNVLSFLQSVSDQLTPAERQNLEILGKSQQSQPYFLYMRDLIYAKNLFLAVPQDLARHLEYIHTVSTMGMDRILFEAHEYAYRVKKAMAGDNKDLLHLIQVQHDIDLLLRVTELKATENEVKAFGPRLGQFMAMTEALVRSQGRDSASPIVRGSELRRLISSSIDYYTMAIARNEPMVENTLALMNSGKVAEWQSDKRNHDKLATVPLVTQLPSTAVLVAGGFHTDQITQMLRRANVSYVVMTPNVDRIDSADESLYYRRLRGEHASLQELRSVSRRRQTGLLSRLLPKRFSNDTLQTMRNIPVAEYVTSTMNALLAAYGVGDVQLGPILETLKAKVAALGPSVSSAVRTAAAGWRPGTTSEEPRSQDPNLELGQARAPMAVEGLNDEPVREDLVGRHHEFETVVQRAIDAGARPIALARTPENREILGYAIYADLGPLDGGYFFQSSVITHSGGTPAYIRVINSRLPVAARNEIVQHEADDLYFRKLLAGQENVNRTSHRLAAIRQSLNRNHWTERGITRYHEWALSRMSADQLNELISEHPNRLKNSQALLSKYQGQLRTSNITEDDIRAYETRFIEFAKKMLVLRVYVESVYSAPNVSPDILRHVLLATPRYENPEFYGNTQLYSQFVDVFVNNQDATVLGYEGINPEIAQLLLQFTDHCAKTLGKDGTLNIEDALFQWLKTENLTLLGRSSEEIWNLLDRVLPAKRESWQLQPNQRQRMLIAGERLRLILQDLQRRETTGETSWHGIAIGGMVMALLIGVAAWAMGHPNVANEISMQTASMDWRLLLLLAPSLFPQDWLRRVIKPQARPGEDIPELTEGWDLPAGTIDLTRLAVGSKFEMSIRPSADSPAIRVRGRVEWNGAILLQRVNADGTNGPAWTIDARAIGHRPTREFGNRIRPVGNPDGMLISNENIFIPALGNAPAVYGTLVELRLEAPVVDDLQQQGITLAPMSLAELWERLSRIEPALHLPERRDLRPLSPAVSGRGSNPIQTQKIDPKLLQRILAIAMNGLEPQPIQSKTPAISARVLDFVKTLRHGMPNAQWDRLLQVWNQSVAPKAQPRIPQGTTFGGPAWASRGQPDLSPEIPFRNQGNFEFGVKRLPFLASESSAYPKQVPWGLTGFVVLVFSGLTALGALGLNIASGHDIATYLAATVGTAVFLIVGGIFHGYDLDNARLGRYEDAALTHASLSTLESLVRDKFGPAYVSENAFEVIIPASIERIGPEALRQRTGAISHENRGYYYDTESRILYVLNDTVMGPVNNSLYVVETDYSRSQRHRLFVSENAARSTLLPFIVKHERGKAWVQSGHAWFERLPNSWKPHIAELFGNLRELFFFVPSQLFTRLSLRLRMAFGHAIFPWLLSPQRIIGPIDWSAYVLGAPGVYQRTLPIAPTPLAFDRNRLRSLVERYIPEPPQIRIPAGPIVWQGVDRAAHALTWWEHILFAIFDAIEFMEQSIDMAVEQLTRTADQLRPRHWQIDPQTILRIKGAIILVITLAAAGILAWQFADHFPQLLDWIRQHTAVDPSMSAHLNEMKTAGAALFLLGIPLKERATHIGNPETLTPFDAVLAHLDAIRERDWGVEQTVIESYWSDLLKDVPGSKEEKSNAAKTVVALADTLLKTDYHKTGFDPYMTKSIFLSELQVRVEHEADMRKIALKLKAVDPSNSAAREDLLRSAVYRHLAFLNEDQRNYPPNGIDGEDYWFKLFRKFEIDGDIVPMTREASKLFKSAVSTGKRLDDTNFKTTVAILLGQMEAQDLMKRAEAGFKTDNLAEQDFREIAREVLAQHLRSLAASNTEITKADLADKSYWTSVLAKAGADKTNASDAREWAQAVASETVSSYKELPSLMGRTQHSQLESGKAWDLLLTLQEHRAKIAIRRSELKTQKDANAIKHLAREIVRDELAFLKKHRNAFPSSIETAAHWKNVFGDLALGPEVGAVITETTAQIQNARGDQSWDSLKADPFYRHVLAQQAYLAGIEETKALKLSESNKAVMRAHLGHLIRLHLAQVAAVNGRFPEDRDFSDTFRRAGVGDVSDNIKGPLLAHLGELKGAAKNQSSETTAQIHYILDRWGFQGIEPAATTSVANEAENLFIFRLLRDHFRYLASDGQTATVRFNYPFGGNSFSDLLADYKIEIPYRSELDYAKSFSEIVGIVNNRVGRPQNLSDPAVARRFFEQMAIELDFRLPFVPTSTEIEGILRERVQKELDYYLATGEKLPDSLTAGVTFVPEVSKKLESQYQEMTGFRAAVETVTTEFQTSRRGAYAILMQGQKVHQVTPENSPKLVQWIQRLWKSLGAVSTQREMLGGLFGGYMALKILFPTIAAHTSIVHLTVGLLTAWAPVALLGALAFGVLIPAIQGARQPLTTLELREIAQASAATTNPEEVYVPNNMMPNDDRVRRSWLAVIRAA